MNKGLTAKNLVYYLLMFSVCVTAFVKEMSVGILVNSMAHIGESGNWYFCLLCAATFYGKLYASLMKKEN